MISNKIVNKIKQRHQAFIHLLDIAVYHGVDPLSIEQLRVPSPEAFFSLAGGQLTEDREGFILNMDQNPIAFQKTDGAMIYIVFISSKLKTDTISKSSLEEPLKKFLIDINAKQMIPTEKGQLNTDTLIDIIQGNKNSKMMTIDFDMQLILYSEEKIESSTYNTLINYNEKIRNPIKHFTIAQLQYDPTKHITGPRICRVLSDAEVDDLITRQIGLRGEYGIDDLGEDYLKKLEEFEDNPIQQNKIRNELREYVLTKLPTMNSTDPWVKWRGFRIGDVVFIERRIGPTPICYRRVVKLDKEIYSESKKNAEKAVK